MPFFEIDGIPVHVIQESSVKVDSEINIKSTPLHSNPQEKSFLHFYNAGYSGKSFQIEILVRKDEYHNNKNVKQELESWLEHGSVHTIVTDAVDITNGEYIITSCSSSQDYLDESKWSLSFSQYWTQENYGGVEDNNSTGKDTSTETSNAYILAKCPVPLTPTSNSTECVSALQTLLKQAGYYLFHEGKYLEVDGVYSDKVVLAVSLLQKDYQKEFNLTVNGLFDNQTRNCLLQII